MYECDCELMLVNCDEDDPWCNQYRGTPPEPLEDEGDYYPPDDDEEDR